ncbi:regulator of DNA class I crossover intermediates 1 isoform X2 [Anolis carolinensis]
MPVHVEINRGIKHPLRRHNVELPKSPERRPSKSFSDDIQLRVQQEVLENRRKYLLEKENIKAQSLQASQLANTKCEDPWLSKPPHWQNNFNKPTVEGHAGLYFHQINSPGCSSMFDKSPKFTADADFGSNHREDPLVGIVNDPMKNTHGESSHPITALFEEKNQQFLTLPSSQSCHSFAKKNPIDQLFTDSIDAHQISNLHSLYTSEQTACSVQRQSAERDLKGIFTAPEQILFSNSQSLNAVDQETAKTQLKDCYPEERNSGIFTDQQENTRDIENTGRFENQMKNMNVAETIENYFQKCREDGLAESNLNHLQIFGFEEREKACCNYYDEYSNQGESKGYESSQSSLSPSYPPKQTERYMSTTSDESDKKEQDDKASCFFENAFPRSHGNSLSASGNQRAQCSHQSVDMYSVFLESASRETVDIHHQTKSDIGLRKNMAYRTGKDLLGVSFENQYVNFNPRCNAWSQTEPCGTDGIKKCDAAIQCNIMQACGCKNVLSSVHSAEIISSTSRVQTTGGQSIPADRAALLSSSC